ncbi:MAG: MCE family protein [Bradyrhizobiaceae bacterium]|nr:MCE family protein [Bradyrhizobiaceae bacterium]
MLMEETRRTEFAVGLVSIVGAALLIVGILLGKGCSFSANVQTLHVLLQSSGGLEQGSPVVVNGVKRGKVVGVEPHADKVMATVEVDRADDLHADAHALVSILEITGGKKLEIFPGTSTTPLDPSKPLPGRAAIDVGGLVTIVGDVSGELVTLLRRLDTVTAALNSLMADGTLATNLKSIAADGAVLAHDARVWLQQHQATLSTSITELKGALVDVRRVVNTSEPKLTSVLNKLDSRLTELEGVVSNGNRVIVQADSMIASINGIVTEVKTNRSLLNAVLYDESFRKSMDTLVSKIQMFVEHAKANGMNVNVGLGHR